MNERLTFIPLPVVYPGASAALGANYAYITTCVDMTIIHVSAAPSTNDADVTLAINDDGSAVVAAFACAVAATPGEFSSTAVGGTSAPVFVAAGSKLSLTATGTANGTQIVGLITALVGEVFG